MDEPIKKKVNLELEITPNNIGVNPFHRWIHLARTVDAWRIFPRVFVTVYIVLLYDVVTWFMTLEEPNLEQAGLVSITVGAMAAVFGIYAGTGNTQIEELIPVLCDELKNSPNSISEKEINRGKAQLKASLMMGRESAFRRCESAARQLLVFNKVIDPIDTIKQIDAVSKDTVQKIAKKIVSGAMTISSIGPIKKLETLDKIQKRLG